MWLDGDEGGVERVVAVLFAVRTLERVLSIWLNRAQKAAS